MTAAVVDLHAQILDSFQPLTIFVAFVTVLFGLRYPTIATSIAKTLPDKALKLERQYAQKALARLLWSQCVPLTLLIALPTYLFAPLALRVIRHSAFTPWNFDTLRTGFVILTAYMLAASAWTLVLTLRLATKAYTT
jgi:hypothetical protein